MSANLQLFCRFFGNFHALYMVGHRAQQAKRMRAAKGALTALRDAVRTDFGADSPEYERAGRTPLSKRGRAASKKNATEAVTPVAITTN